MKGIDAVSREQLVQILAFPGIRNVTPVFSLVPALGPIRTAALLPTITEEDKVILNNVQKIVEFLAAGTAASSNQVTTILWFYLSLKKRGEKISRYIFFLGGDCVNLWYSSRSLPILSWLVILNCD